MFLNFKYDKIYRNCYSRPIYKILPSSKGLTCLTHCYVNYSLYAKILGSLIKNINIIIFFKSLTMLLKHYSTSARKCCIITKKCSRILYIVSYKNTSESYCDNFGKCKRNLVILSLFHFEINCILPSHWRIQLYPRTGRLPLSMDQSHQT